MSILSGYLAETIGDALIDADIPFDVVITRDMPGDGGEPFNPRPPVSTDYSCQGFVESYSTADMASGLVGANDAKIIVIATTLAMPSPPQAGDRATAAGKTYSIVKVSVDPAGALYELQARA